MTVSAKFEVEAQSSARLFIDSHIGEDFFGGGVTSACVREFLDANPEVDTLFVEVNSMGGDLFEAIGINAALDRWRTQTGGKVVAEVVGIAASAAVNITSNADEVRIADGSQMMIHNSSSMTFGNKEAHQRTIETLARADETMARLHTRKTKRKLSEVIEAMNAETSFSPTEALEFGLADEIFSEIKVAANMDAWRSNSKYQQYMARRMPATAKKEDVMNNAKLAAMLGCAIAEIESELARVIGRAAEAAEVGTLRAEVTATKAENAALKAKNEELTNSASTDRLEARIQGMVADGRLTTSECQKAVVYRQLWKNAGEEVAELSASTWTKPEALGQPQHRDGDRAGNNASDNRRTPEQAFELLPLPQQNLILGQKGKYGRTDCIVHGFRELPHLVAKWNVQMPEVN